MTAGGGICARCQGPLGSDFETVVPDSASGARPPQRLHPVGTPACRPRSRGAAVTGRTPQGPASHAPLTAGRVEPQMLL